LHPYLDVWIYEMLFSNIQYLNQFHAPAGGMCAADSSPLNSWSMTKSPPLTNTAADDFQLRHPLFIRTLIGTIYGDHGMRSTWFPACV
jgi:hypothetical protein